jgi:hypothetical protein
VSKRRISDKPRSLSPQPIGTAAAFYRKVFGYNGKTIAGSGDAASSELRYIRLKAETDYRKLALVLIRHLYPDLVIIEERRGRGRPHGSRDVKLPSATDRRSHKTDTDILLPTGLPLFLRVERIKEDHRLRTSEALRRLLRDTFGAALKARGYSDAKINKSIEGKFGSLHTRYYEARREAQKKGLWRP